MAFPARPAVCRPLFRKGTGVEGDGTGGGRLSMDLSMYGTIATYALRNILRTRLRSFFTLSSVALIMMLYTVVTSIGDSLTQQVAAAVQQEDLSIVIQSRYAPTPASSFIDETTRDAITALDGVQSHQGVLIDRKRLNGKVLVFVLGVTDYAVVAQRLGLKIVRGQGFRNGRDDLIVGEKAARVLGLDVGQRLDLSSTIEATVVGVYSTWINFLNAGIITDLGTAQALSGKPGTLSLLFLGLKDVAATPALVARINRQFPDVQATQIEQIPELFSHLKSFFYFSKIVTGLILMIAVAVLLNTFIMAISERTREIGILGAIGWSRRMIVSVFLVESLLLSLTGSLLGFLSAYPVMFLLQRSFTSVYMYIPVTPGPKVFLSLLLMSLVIGVLSILFPALYGTRISVAEAIRHE